MPELPEVETVKNTLKTKVLNKRIVDVNVIYNKVIDYPTLEEFKKQIINQTINDIKRRGKWIMFELNDYYLLSHLRMEGKYLIRNKDDIADKHQIISFTFDDNTELRYKDVRKFGKMNLIKKEEVYNTKPLSELGLEPWDENLTPKYLLEKYKFKKLPIKQALLDQSIITGIGNIYADEILFMSKINPHTYSFDLEKEDLQKIIDNTKIVLEKAIKLGGTTIRTYESEEGIHGMFQNELLVHGKDKLPCPDCGETIIKTFIAGRGTYYCEKCQK